MAVFAKVTDVLTEGYVEVRVLDADGQPGEERQIAADPLKVRRGDIVELAGEKPVDDRKGRVFYVIPVLVVVVGILITGKLSWPERILSGLLLGLMAFVLVWIQNRKSRLHRRVAWRILRIAQESEERKYTV